AAVIPADGVITIAADQEDVVILRVLVAADDAKGVVVGAALGFGSDGDDGVGKGPAGVGPPDLARLVRGQHQAVAGDGRRGAAALVGNPAAVGVAAEVVGKEGITAAASGRATSLAGGEQE